MNALKKYLDKISEKINSKTFAHNHFQIDISGAKANGILIYDIVGLENGYISLDVPGQKGIIKIQTSKDIVKEIESYLGEFDDDDKQFKPLKKLLKCNKN